MLMTDSDAKIIECSERFYTSLGYTKNEAIGKKLTDYFPSFTHNKIRQAMQMARESGRCPTQPTAMLKANGSFENMEMAFSGVRDENHKLKYYCAILQNVSVGDLSSDL
jgi:PAS domain S-box-containing protein